MRKATRKEEIVMLTKMIGIMEASGNLSANRYLRGRSSLNKIKYVQIQKQSFHHIWQWQEFLVTLKLGWRRYFWGCAHKDSIFVRIQVHQLKSTGGCVCCLYWRAICTGFLIASIISFLISSGKYLS